MLNEIKQFLKILRTPAAKISEPEMRLWFSRVRVGILVLLVVISVFAFAWARHDPGTSTVMQAADWLARLPLTVGTYVLATVAWYLHVQVVDGLRLARWAFQWAMDKPEPEQVRAAKTLAWGLYLGLSWVAACLLFSKALGA